MIIRQVQPTDDLYPQLLARFPNTARYIADPTDGGDYRWFAAIVGDRRMVGGAVIDVAALRFGPLREMIVGFLENIEVDEPMRRQGIGTALLRAALDHAWACGAQNVRWSVDWANQAGIAFYVRNGIGVMPEGDSPKKLETCYTMMAVNPGLVASGYGSVTPP